MFKALAASLLLTAIVADTIELGKIEKKANKAIQGVRDLRQGRLKKGLREKIEEIAAEIAEQKIAEALANFNFAPLPPVATTEKPVVSPTQGPASPNILFYPVGDETSGVFTSPNYPDNYPLNSKKSYLLGIPNQKDAKFGGQYYGISLTFKDFDIEGPSIANPPCPYDRLNLVHFNSRKRRDHDSVDYANYPEPGNFTEADYNYGGDHSVRFL